MFESLSDYLFIYFYSTIITIIRYFKKYKWFFTLNNLNKFKYELSYNHNIYIENLFSFMYIIKSILHGIRYWLFSLIIFLVTYYYLLHVKLLTFLKINTQILFVVMFLYWLISGFVFFIKKYQFSKYTSVVQRFWKRSYAIFWMLETIVFLIFFYLTMNSSEEPVYMYDQIKIYKTHLFSWRWFIVKLVPCILLLLLSYYILLQIKWGLFFRNSTFIFIITIIIIYSVWLEFYQFFHIINWYSNFFWIYDYDENLWYLDLDIRRTRLINNYTALCLMAKFWHLIFIFVFWIFTILRLNEMERITYQLYSANLQNFIILYIMSWLYMFPWFKYLFRKYLDFSYYWFFVNFRDLGVRIFFNDLYLFYFNLIKFNKIILLYNFFYNDFFYWIDSTKIISYTSFIKNNLL